MDRNDLIRALGAAFSDAGNNKGDDSKPKTEAAVTEEKSSARVTDVHENNPRFELLRTHPESYVVDSLVAELLKSGDRTAEKAGHDLEKKFEGAVQEKQNDKIDAIIQEARDIFMKLRSTDAGSSQRMLVYMLAVDKISRF